MPSEKGPQRSSERWLLPWSPADFPWTRGPLVLSATALAEVEAQAVAGYSAGQETCGVLCGPESDAGLCDEVKPLMNLAALGHMLHPDAVPPPRRAFAIQKEKLATLGRAGAARGRPVKVLYHSHLDGSAQFSRRDRAFWSRGRIEKDRLKLGPGPPWPLAFWVTSVRGGKVDEHRAFVWSAGDFRRIEWRAR
jgi:[CysO sulfur-carrier protein]-S-L-cysteine hydrolase